jgi:ATP-dependent Lhr-like helicase
LTDVGRLASLLDRATGTMVHVDLDRITPLAVPVLIMIGRELAPAGAAEDELLIQAEALAEQAMRTA